MKEAAAARRLANVGSINILRLHEEYVSPSLYSTRKIGPALTALVLFGVSSNRARDETKDFLDLLRWRSDSDIDASRTLLSPR